MSMLESAHTTINPTERRERETDRQRQTERERGEGKRERGGGRERDRERERERDEKHNSVSLLLLQLFPCDYHQSNTEVLDLTRPRTSSPVFTITLLSSKECGNDENSYFVMELLYSGFESQVLVLQFLVFSIILLYFVL